MSERRVLVTGGRTYDRAAYLRAVLDDMHAKEPISLLIVGGASGADALAEQWARDAGVPVRVVEANWSRFGRAAGPLRNQRMIDEHFPNVVVAFEGGRGTSDMVRRAKDAGVRVIYPNQPPFPR